MRIESRRFYWRFAAVFVTAVLWLGACGAQSPAQNPAVTVYKNATCSCCSAWADHLKKEGFQVQIETVNDVTPVRRKFGVPDSLAACHTAVVEGYVVEGHVPATDIKRLLAERPAAKGIAVPGMPVGSPGMEHGDRQQPYDVYLFGDTAGPKVFASHGRAGQ